MLRKAERSHIEDMVKAAAFALQPDLVEIRHEFQDDCTGDPSIFFTLVVADKIVVGRYPSFERVRWMEEVVRRIVEPDEYGLNSYFTCRSKSEEMSHSKETARC